MRSSLKFSRCLGLGLGLGLALTYAGGAAAAGPQSVVKPLRGCLPSALDPNPVLPECRVRLMVTPGHVAALDVFGAGPIKCVLRRGFDTHPAAGVDAVDIAKHGNLVAIQPKRGMAVPSNLVLVMEDGQVLGVEMAGARNGSHTVSATVTFGEPQAAAPAAAEPQGCADIEDRLQALGG